MRATCKSFIQKKAFSKTGLHCTFCRKAGHEFYFCPLRPTEPPEAARSLWADALIKGDTPTQAEFPSLGAWSSLGAHLNTGNPWTASPDILDRLRGRLGYWKALGANRSVLSWLAYGLPLRFHSEPPHWVFSNHRSYLDHQEFAKLEIEGHVADGRFRTVDASYVLHSSPQQVEQNKKGKLRRCDDLRNINARLAHISVSLEGHSNIPDVVAANDMTFTEDLRKAYYMLAMEPSATCASTTHKRASSRAAACCSASPPRLCISRRSAGQYWGSCGSWG